MILVYRYRAEAKRLGLSTYYTGKPCKYGHIAERVTANGTCKVCVVTISSKVRAKSKDVTKERNARYYADNAETLAVVNRTWRKKNPERLKSIRDAHYKANRPAYTAASAKRKAAILMACPPWADHKAIAMVYAEAARISTESGIPHDVDHIVPLQGKNVCGLHVHWNLSPLPASANRAKQNRF